jgi:prevent-host-death family protein
MTMVGSEFMTSATIRTIPAGEFKAKCLAVMAEVNSTGRPVLVTKRGKPLARVMPVEELAPKESVDAIFGSLRGLISIPGQTIEADEPFIPLEEWDHLKDDWSLFPPE